MIDENSIRQCLTQQHSSPSALCTALFLLTPRKREVHDLSDMQIQIIVKTFLTTYYQSSNQDRTYLDWISSFMNQFKTKQDLNKELGNNLIISLLNSYAHHFLYHNDQESMLRSLENVTAYIDNDIPIDIIVLSIGINNRSVLEMTNSNFQAAYRLSSQVIDRLEEYIEEKKMKKSKLLEEDVVVLVNTYLIICQALNCHLKKIRQWGEQEYQYQIDLAHNYAKGIKMSEFYLGDESVITKAFKVICDDISPVDEIPIVKIIVTPCQQTATPSQVKMDSILRMLQTRIQHIQQIFVNDQKPEQHLLPSISAILPKKISEMSLNPSNKDIQLIKQINSFDDIPLNPTISNQIPVSPVYSSVAPIEFPAPRKTPLSPISTPLAVTPQAERGFSEIMERIQKIQQEKERLKAEEKQEEPEQQTHSIIQKIEEIVPEPIHQKSLPSQSLNKLFQLLLQRFTAQQLNLLIRKYQTQQVQIFLIRQQKQIDSMMLSIQQIQKFSSKTYAAPFLLTQQNVSPEQKIIYYVLPYCQVSDEKLVMLRFPRSVIPSQKCIFLGQEVNIVVVFIQLNEFRIFLTKHNENNQQDLVFSYELYLSEQEADDKITNYIQNMATHHRIKNLFNKYNRFKINTDPVQISVNSPNFQKLDSFIQQIRQSISLMQQFILQRQLQLYTAHDNLTSSQQHLFIYYLDQFIVRSSINYITSVNHNYTISLQNHLKFPQQIIKLKQTVEYNYEQVFEDLGMMLVQQKQEMLYVMTIISDKHRLRKIRKDFVEEDYRLYSAHPIDQNIQFLNISFKRQIHYQHKNYWITTATLVCSIDNNPLGIKLTIYFPLTSSTSNTFLPLSKYLWLKERKTIQSSHSKFKITQAEKRRLKKKVFLNQFPVVSNYNVTQVMAKGGWREVIDGMGIREGKVENREGGWKTARLECLLLDNFN